MTVANPVPDEMEMCYASITKILFREHSNQFVGYQKQLAKDYPELVNGHRPIKFETRSVIIVGTSDLSLFEFLHKEKDYFLNQFRQGPAASLIPMAHRPNYHWDGDFKVEACFRPISFGQPFSLGGQRIDYTFVQISEKYAELRQQQTNKGAS